MEPISAALILAGLAASSAAAVYTNKKNIEYASEANDASVALANTAHQREVRDLRAAGLNPILSASGNGAAVPQLKVPDLSNPLGGAATTARDLASAVNGQLDAEIRGAQASASSAESESRVLEREEYLHQQRAMLEDIDNSARLQALLGDPRKDKDVQVIAGDRGMRANFGGDGTTKAYDDLVSKYRRDLWNGAYNANPIHTVWNDVDRGLSSAQAVENLIVGWRKGMMPTEHIRESKSFLKNGVRHYYERSR